MEAAVSTIQDCEDSVATVDTADIVAVYRNWFGLMNRSLTHTFVKQGEPIQRAIYPDRHYRTAAGTPA